MAPHRILLQISQPKPAQLRDLQQGNARHYSSPQRMEYGANHLETMTFMQKLCEIKRKSPS
jgi:hypothetical protein